jgi:hypothetical protein
MLAHCEHRVPMDDTALSTLKGYRAVLEIAGVSDCAQLRELV